MTQPGNERKKIAVGQHSAEEAYWLKTFSSEPVFSCFPVDREGTPGEREMESCRYSITGQLFQAVEKLRNGSDPRLSMILTAVVSLLLGKTAGKTDVILGTSIYKQKTGGRFLNTVLPLRIRQQPGMSFKELLLQVRAILAEADKNRNYPVESLLYMLGMSQEEGDFPLFDVVILLDNIHNEAYIQATKPNIIFLFSRTPHQLDLTLRYNRLRYDGPTIDGIIQRLVMLLQHAMADVSVTLQAMELVTADEKKRLIEEFNNTAAPFPETKTLHRLFEEQVERTPHRLALVGEGGCGDGDTGIAAHGPRRHSVP